MIRKINSFLSAQLGIDLGRLGLALVALPKFFQDWNEFRKGTTQKIVLKPCLHDSAEEGGTAKGEYFWQDLYVASYREIEVIDIRPIQAVIPGVVFMRMDMMSSKVTMENYCDSISCLHALEHFGLGRYGDPLDPEGHVKGLQNIAKLLKLSGRLYLSVPIGLERIEFNANRVFCPERMVELAKKTGFVLDQLAWIANDQPVVASTDPLTDIQSLKKMHYALGIFVFTKQSELKFPKY